MRRTIFCRPIFGRPIEIRGQRLAGVGLLHARDLLGRALGYDAAAFFSAFGAEIEDPVGVADDVQVVLDDDDRVSEIGETVQNVEQLAHIVEMQSGGRLVQQIKSFSGLALAEFAGELDALGFASGERDGRLTEVNVSQADVDQGLQLLLDLRNVFENLEHVRYGHFEQVGDGIAVVADRQRFVVVAASAADFALHVNVGQEIHFDAALAFALAGFAASAGNVEGEASGFVSALARFGQHGVEVANRREDAGIGCGIGARSASDGRLVDANDLVDQLRSGDGFVRAGFFAGTIELLGERAVQDVIDQSGFAGAGNAGDNRHHAERKDYVEILEVVLARAEDGDRFAIRAAALGKHGDPLASGDVGAGERGGRVHDFRRRSAGDQLAAMTAGAGAEVDDIVGAADGFFIVLDDEHGVAEVAQVFERGEKAPVVAMVQADGRFVENVEDAAQFGSDLRGEADALAFSTGERGGGAAELQVAESDVVQEFEAFGDFVGDASGDGQFPAGQFDFARGFESARNRQAGEIGNRHAVHFYRQAFRTQTLAVAN